MREKNNKIFKTNDPKLKNKLMQLGHSFTQAIAENNNELAESICQEANVLKNKSRRNKQ